MLDNYPDVLTINDVMSILHIGRSKTYEMLKTNVIPNIRIGKKFVIPKKAMIDFLEIKN